MNATIQKTQKRRRKSRSFKKEFSPDMLMKIYELLEGERDMLKVHSKALNSEICFVNPDFKKSKMLPTDCPTYTTRELAFVLSMSPTELQRYHYLKMKLV